MEDGLYHKIKSIYDGKQQRAIVFNARTSPMVAYGMGLALL